MTRTADAQPAAGSVLVRHGLGVQGSRRRVVSYGEYRDVIKACRIRRILSLNPPMQAPPVGLVLLCCVAPSPIWNDTQAIDPCLPELHNLQLTSAALDRTSETRPPLAPRRASLCDSS